ncbi:MAG: site-specific DNA-methyltransferase [Candidatus Marinimicrobia bacterium]|nr:site-specific DNA-methyltransferase [Candidatus Neomarinimicrobiota bacterium]
MAHLSEDCRPLLVEQVSVSSNNELLKALQGFNDVCLIVLPLHSELDRYRKPLKNIGFFIENSANQLGPEATLISLGEISDLVQVHAEIPSTLRYQHWITIKRKSPKEINARSLPNNHFGALIHTRYKKSLRHVKTRIEYSYCPNCDKTTKDYGGKKHTYHQYGTLLSDVWRDIACELDGDISPVILRFQDLFGFTPYKKLLVLDCRLMKYIPVSNIGSNTPDWVQNFNAIREASPQYFLFRNNTGQDDFENGLSSNLKNRLINGDCLEQLRDIPDNSIDFVFTDPPYNLGKKYSGYSDDLQIKKYFNWCDQWIAELARVLKPGRTLTLLNIPIWSIRHFLFIETVLQFQNWIVWDALSFPVRLIMPAHYTILAFSKGDSRELPGLIGESGQTSVPNAPLAFESLKPLAESYCLRSSCVKHRQMMQVDDHTAITDLWWDIHRLKHNSRRVDHPTQLPPHLMYRLISIFTKANEIVLDCFNGSGTTTLTAHQLGRQYIGIEKSEKYFRITQKRHKEIIQGLDPFRKEERKLTVKNSPVPRLRKQKYEVPKKTLQLEVKRIAQKLGKLPTREEVEEYGKYSIKYYDEYFVSWGEVCAAARTTGMTEIRNDSNNDNGNKNTDLGVKQLSFSLDEEH